jgi:hypothetical protein
MNPLCNCTFCTVNYHCPNCARKPPVHAKCRLEAEIKAKKDAELRAIAKIERDRLERGQADELAGAMNEFFTALYTQNSDAYPGGLDASSYLASSFSGELPLPSPDSITVTTEFGVLEETGNVTTISAGPYLHAYDDAAEDDEEEEHEEEDAGFHSSLPYHPHHIHSSLDQEVVMTEDTSSLLLRGQATGSPPWRCSTSSSRIRGCCSSKCRICTASLLGRIPASNPRNLLRPWWRITKDWWTSWTVGRAIYWAGPKTRMKGTRRTWIRMRFSTMKGTRMKTP